MLGLIPKVLIDLVTSVYGAEAAVEIRRRAGCDLDLEFRLNEVYDDELWRNLLLASTEVLHCSSETLEEEYARYFLRDAQERWPAWFKMSKTAREFLERHPAVHNNFADGVRSRIARSHQG